jgi:hypothetical protein
LIKNIVSELVEGGVVMLQYADDTIFLLEDDTESAINLKVILIIFGHMSSLKINFLKSEVCCFGQYAAIFTCAEGKIHFKYLGVSTHYTRLLNSDWRGAEARMEINCILGR